MKLTIDIETLYSVTENVTFDIAVEDAGYGKPKEYYADNVKGLVSFSYREFCELREEAEDDNDEFVTKIEVEGRISCSENGLKYEIVAEDITIQDKEVYISYEVVLD